MSPELIAAIAAGLVAVISAIATAQSKRSQRQTEELANLRADNRDLRRMLRGADRWSGQLLRVIDRAGLDAPAPPDDLDGDHDQSAATSRDSFVPPAGGVPRRRRLVVDDE